MNQKTTHNFTRLDIFQIVTKEFKIELDGEHGISHWQRVYNNCLELGKFYGISSSVFELFALLHDSKREDEYEDKDHGKRAALFVKELVDKKIIELSKEDKNRLIFACSNHTKPNKRAKLYDDMVVQICFDADRLDIGRVGTVPKQSYFSTQYAKDLVRDEKYFFAFG